MAKQSIGTEIMEYMVWIVEIVSAEFFEGDKPSGYNSLKSSGLWDIYVDHYDTTHTLGQEYLLNEIREFFTNHGVNTRC